MIITDLLLFRVLFHFCFFIINYILFIFFVGKVPRRLRQANYIKNMLDSSIVIVHVSIFRKSWSACKRRSPNCKKKTKSLEVKCKQRWRKTNSSVNVMLELLHWRNSWKKEKTFSTTGPKCRALLEKICRRRRSRFCL